MISVKFFETVMGLEFSGRGFSSFFSQEKLDVFKNLPDGMIGFDDLSELDYYFVTAYGDKRCPSNSSINYRDLAQKCKLWVFQKGFDVIVGSQNINVINLLTGECVFTGDSNQYDPAYEIMACEFVFNKMQ